MQTSRLASLIAAAAGCTVRTKQKRREERVVAFFVIVPLLDLEDREPDA